MERKCTNCGRYGTPLFTTRFYTKKDGTVVEYKYKRYDCKFCYNNHPKPDRENANSTGS
jgi:hypothetical protein